uniref:DUF7355 domain-containing protein n=1 Tax=Klebsiella phage Phi_KR8 TaxID=3240397 RepID=A0AB39U168_9CAUD
MFPKYSEVVKVSFTQVVANHLTDEFTPSEVAKMHGRVFICHECTYSKRRSY